MMVAGGLLWLLSLVVLLLVGAAAIKYLFFHPTRPDRSSRLDGEPGPRTPAP